MQFLTRILPSFFVSWLVTFTLASLFHSQYVVNQLVAVGVDVAFSDRLSLTIDDWIGLMPTYGIILVVALTIAFVVTSWISRKYNKLHNWLFMVAGLCAFAAVLLVIESIMNIHLVAGARGWGFYLQLLAGGIGGFIFSKLYKTREVK